MNEDQRYPYEVFTLQELQELLFGIGELMQKAQEAGSTEAVAKLEKVAEKIRANIEMKLLDEDDI